MDMKALYVSYGSGSTSTEPSFAEPRPCTWYRVAWAAARSIFIITSVIVVAVFGLHQFLLAHTLPQVEGVLSIQGLKDTVTISRDRDSGVDL